MTFRRQLTPKAEQLIQDIKQIERDQLNPRWTLDDLKRLMILNKTSKEERSEQLESTPGYPKRRG